MSAGRKLPLQAFVERHLDPGDSLSEMLFGLVMTLTFTLGAGLIVEDGPDAVRQMLLGILGCNVAWGIVDGAMYLMGRLLDRSRKARLIEAIRRSATDDEALRIIGKELDPRLASLTNTDERYELERRILARLRGLAPEATHLRKEDFLGALAVFYLVFFSTIPAVLPFLAFRDRFLALRVSNLLLLALLFLTGFRFSQAAHGHPWRFGTTLLLVGLALVGVVIALGG